MKHSKVQRILYGTWAIAALVLLTIVDVQIAHVAERIDGRWGDLLQRGSVIPLLFLLLTGLGARELARLANAAGARPFHRVTAVMVAVLVAVPWLSAAGWLGSSPADIEGLYWSLIVLLAAVAGAAVAAALRGDPSGSIRDAGITFLILLYLGLLASTGLQLRCGRNIPGQQGAWLLLISMLVIKASDIGAYFVGSAFGRHRLAPAISPGKSVEGAIGGVALSAAASVGLVFGARALADLPSAHPIRTVLGEASIPFGTASTPGGLGLAVGAITFGILLSLAGQVGDLLESCFKRDAGTKDSGVIVPQFGGILDLVDSPILALPIAWFWLTKVWGVV